jgi:adenosylmethionine-8-amino-7-oxononanoate aminotransferase
MSINEDKPQQVAAILIEPIIKASMRSPDKSSAEIESIQLRIIELEGGR